MSVAPEVTSEARKSEPCTGLGSLASTASVRSRKARESGASALFHIGDADADKKTQDDVGEDYPMLCFCQAHNHCTFARGGHHGRLSFSTKFMFGIPYVGWYSVSYMKKSVMKPFYTDDYPKASLGYIAFFSTIAVIVDAFTDPAMANWTDVARPKIWGRRRPFVLLGGIMAAFIFPLSFTVLVPSGLPASIWYGVFHIGTKLCETVLLITMDAWGAELTPSVNERTSVWTFREFFTVFGIMLGVLMAGFFENFGGVDCTETPSTGCTGYPVLSFIFSVMCLLACIVCVLSGRERPNSRLHKPPVPGTWTEEDIVPTLMSTGLNRPFRSLIVSDVVEAFGANLMFVIMPYVARVVIGDACLKPSLLFAGIAGCSMLARIMTIPLWTWAGRRYGKFQTYLFFNFALAASQVPFIFMAKDSGDCTQTFVTLGISLVWGGIYSGSLFLKSIMADVVDYDEFLTGKRREGQYFMAINFFPKFLEVPAEAIPFLLMAYLGYQRPREDGVAVEQPESVVWLMRLCMSLGPALFIFFGALVLRSYPEGARDSEAHGQLMVAIIEKHNKGLPAEDPWFPGHVIDPPPPPAKHDDVLAYFWPSELKASLESSSDIADYATLKRRTLRGVILGVCILPVGIIMVLEGLEDMGSDLGASISPIGVIFVGLATLFIWFDGLRYCAAREVEKRTVARTDLIARYNFLCRFTGSDLMAGAPRNEAQSEFVAVMPSTTSN